MAEPGWSSGGGAPVSPNPPGIGPEECRKLPSGTRGEAPAAKSFGACWVPQVSSLAVPVNYKPKLAIGKFFKLANTGILEGHCYS